MAVCLNVYGLESRTTIVYWNALKVAGRWSGSAAKDSWVRPARPGARTEAWNVPSTAGMIGAASPPVVGCRPRTHAGTREAHDHAARPLGLGGKCDPGIERHLGGLARAAESFERK